MQILQAIFAIIFGVCVASCGTTGGNGYSNPIDIPIYTGLKDGNHSWSHPGTPGYPF